MPDECVLDRSFQKWLHLLLTQKCHKFLHNEKWNLIYSPLLLLRPTHLRWGQRSSLRSVDRSLDVGLPSPPLQSGRSEARGVTGALFRMTGRPACRAILLTSLVLMMVLLTGIIVFLFSFLPDRREWHVFIVCFNFSILHLFVRRKNTNSCRPSWKCPRLTERYTGTSVLAASFTRWKRTQMCVDIPRCWRRGDVALQWKKFH